MQIQVSNPSSIIYQTEPRTQSVIITEVFLLSIFVVLGMEGRALHVLGKHFTTDLHRQSAFKLKLSPPH
jgi:hypothetical protein